MSLKSFSTLTASFAAGLVLCGCASGPRYYASPYVNSAPAFTTVATPDGQAYLGATAQAPVYFNNPAAQPRYPYGYNNANPANVLLGTVAGAAIGNAFRPGNAGMIAAGAIGGAVLGSSGDPCSGLNAGTVLGGGVGYALGSQIGRGNGRKTAEVVGALIGSSVGTRSSNGCR